MEAVSLNLHRLTLDPRRRSSARWSQPSRKSWASASAAEKPKRFRILSYEANVANRQRKIINATSLASGHRSKLNLE